MSKDAKKILATKHLDPHFEQQVKVLRTFMAEATPAAAKKVLDPAGLSGNTFTPPQPHIKDSRPPRGWEPRVVYGPSDNPLAGAVPSAIYSPALPEGLDEAEALTQTLSVLAAMVPAGYVARLAEVRLDSAGWQRKFSDTVGGGTGEAFTGAVRRYKWVVEPEPDAGTLGGGMSEADWTAVLDRVSKAKFPAVKIVTDTRAVDLVVPHGDLQAGQHDGDSVEGLVGRMAIYPLIVKAELARLRRSGTVVKRIVMPSLGDLVENVTGFYANQAWVVNLNMRQQRTLVRRLITAMIEEVATLGLPILVPVVPGNHGENRNSKGKAFTDVSDNSDIEVMETVAEILRANKRLARQVEFHFPSEEKQTLTLDLGFGYGVAFHHGHLSGHGSGHAAAKQQAYLRSQALAEMPIGRARYIITGHFHSAMMVTMPGNKTWIQIPALCDTSEHFEEHYGLNGGPGILTFTFGPDGLSNYMVHKTPTLSTVGADLADAEDALTERSA